ncbi:topoisomerase [Yersinia phage vB_Yru_GN1]|uniref:DNA topoisomerase (ATP-hydrolyzing) n=1 Tax=Yersinia phage vB_Yru_GN1 TaxID=3074381 RepID=A0AA86JCV6_9CAUD|nr:topoisomerase [Yersinia phage vB_Yru_GN1]
MSHKEAKINKLSWPRNIQERASAYGHDYKTPNLMFREIVDNTIDLILKYRLSLNVLAFTNLDKDYHLVYDDGPGIPIYKDPDYEEEQPITVDLLTRINVGSNFNQTEYSIGLNGIGIKLACGLSEDFYIIVNASKKDISTFPDKLKSQYSDECKYFVINFKMGYLQDWKLVSKGALLEMINLKEVNSKLDELVNDKLGTIVLFKPSSEFVEENTISYHAYPLKLMKNFFQYDDNFKVINLNFRLNGKEIPAFDFREHFGCKLFQDKVFNGNIDFETNLKLPVKLIFSFGYALDSFSNDNSGSINLSKSEKGEHVKMIHRALGRALKKYNPSLKGTDAKYGLRLFSLAFVIKPIYTSQTKENLSKFGDEGFSLSYSESELSEYLYEKIVLENTEYFTGLCNRILEYKRSLEHLSKKDFIMSQVSYATGDPTASLSMGSKIFDCSSNKLEEREVYLTEGKSAGNSLCRVRNTKTTAVVPLRGVPMNSAVASLKSVLNNNEFKSIINILGTGVDPFIKMEKRRYSKVIIASDADAAGGFIRALLLGFFATYLRPWIDGGYVYVLKSPLYRQGKKYFFTDEGLDKKKPFTRFKGLGELNKDEVKETLIDNRVLVRVTSEDIDKALNLIINASNERKDLSRELGILGDEEDFLAGVSKSTDDILGLLDLAGDDDDNESEDDE